MHRKNVDKHIAFGHGVHKCLGSRIAKMQLRLAFERIFERFPQISWTGKQTIANALVHAISSLQVNLYGANGKRPTQVAVNGNKIVKRFNRRYQAFTAELWDARKTYVTASLLFLHFGRGTFVTPQIPAGINVHTADSNRRLV